MVSGEECAQKAVEKCSKPDDIKANTFSPHKSSIARLKKPNEFKTVYNKAHPVDGAIFVLYSIKNGLGFSRFGISCSKAKVPLATRRNRIKRLIKESLRLLKEFITSGYDFVIVVKRPKKKIELMDVKRDIYNILKLKGLLKSS